MTQSREAFEAWATARFPMFPLARPPGNMGSYSSTVAAMLWQAWQAAEAHGMEKAAVICEEGAAGIALNDADQVSCNTCLNCASAIRAAKETT